MQTTNNIILEGDKDPRALNRIRYRITKLAKDLIMLEEILSYMLEALEIIEIPPEPPEQAGRALYERLEIAGMRNQLVRRSMDLKKNIAGAHRFLDVLREMSSVVSEAKMFQLNESLDSNTNRMCTLQDSNERAASSLQILTTIFGGILAFNILDRLTGNNWSVQNSSWFSSFYTSVIVDAPLLWFIISFLVWLVIYIIIWNSYRSSNYKNQGLTNIRLKINRKVHMDRLQQFLRTKVHSYEERQYSDNTDIVKITYNDNSFKDWGGSKPIITLEYDERNRYLFSVVIQYNRRKARKAFVMNAEELREKIMNELNGMDVWDTKGEDKSVEDLAADKRANIEKLIHTDDD
jgi:WD repeat-containing protein 35